MEKIYLIIIQLLYAGLGEDSMNPIAGSICAGAIPDGGSGPGVFLSSDVDLDLMKL